MGNTYIFDDSHDYTGAVATFTDTHGTSRITNISVPLSPIQDLHGYANPWPGGGGVNKWDEEWELGAFSNSTGAKSSSSNTIRSKNRIPILPETEYCFVSHNAVYLYFYDANGDFLPPYVYKAVSGGKVNFTSPQNACYMNFYAYGTSYAQNKSINYPSTVTTYSPYSNICPISGLAGLSVYVSPTQDPDDATVYNVGWSTQAGTVYGGTLDVVTGVLTVDRASAVIDESGTFYKTVTSSNRLQVQVNLIKVGSTAVSDRFSYSQGSSNVGTFYVSTSSARVFFNSPSQTIFTTLEEWNTWLAENPIQVVYELATPLTCQLTAQEVSVIKNSLNNVWASTGSSITVTVKDIAYGFQGWLVKVGSSLTLVPTEMIEAESYKVTPDQRMEESAERDTTGYLWRDTVRNTPPKIEFNTPPVNNTQVAALNAIFQSAFTVKSQRKLQVAFFDPEEDCYKIWDCYMPDVEYPMHLIDPDAKTILYDSIRYAFIGY